jgi:glycosyltransferase involved in cell wall biosynthesis
MVSEKRIRFSGWLKGAEVERALAGADVFVLPSWAEGLPNAMIEAMAARLAVVVTAVGNVPDLVQDGREALLVPPHDVVALREALRRVIEDRALRRKLADAGHALAAQKWSVGPAVDAILDAVASVRGPVQRPRGPRS